jgi:SAM-dependent methyltransferase
MDAALIGDRFPAKSFDLIVSTLVFSELPPDEQRFVLAACHKLLTPNGRILIADEVIPAKSIDLALKVLPALAGMGNERTPFCKFAFWERI